jgi:serine/threonine protein kinase/Tfp pilus assembly protein PilF
MVHTKTLETPTEELTRGSVFAGRYEIIEELGTGGMGKVYRVEDTKAKEEIALKLIKPEIAADKKTIERFRIELTTARKIRHKNICGMYDLGEDKDSYYITMEYVPGEDLKSLIRRVRIDTGTAVKITKQVCEGLSEAHRLGVIHRDLKPSNIMIDKEGNARIMDFGIARSLKEKGITGAGVMIGTPEYMSPEQVEGKEVDQRSDIYSLGVVLYEMTTGRLPFKADTPFAVGIKQKSEIPKNPKELNSQLPDDLIRVILKCLEKDKENRYQNTGEIRSELERLEQDLPTTAQIESKKKPLTSKEITVTFRKRWIIVVSLFGIIILAGLAIIFFSNKDVDLLKDKKMVVVLPFENLGSQEDEYFADGIAFEIMARLAGIPDLIVIDQASSIQYKNTDKSIQEIAGELGVDVILKGTVHWQKSSDGSNRIRVMPQLINVSDAKQIWANVYDNEIIDIFQVQSDIARQVVEALDIALLEPKLQGLEEKPTDNIDAYQAYLRGMDYQRRPDYYYSGEILRMTVQMFERAVEIDPDFAQALAALSRSHSTMYHEGYDRTEKRLAMAKATADKAFNFKSDLTAAHMALGYYYYHGKKDYKNALEQFTIALDNEPQSSDILSSIGFIQRRQGMFELSLENQKKAFQFSPRDGQHASNIGATSQIFRKYAEAESYFNHSISLIPDQTFSYVSKALNYWLWNGDLDKARATLENIPQRNTPLSTYNWYYQELYERDYTAAIERLSRFPDDFFENEDYFIPKVQLIGQAYELMGKPELAHASYKAAYTMLEKKVQEYAGDARIHSSLGLVYASLGHKEEAIREGKLGVELNPVSGDTMSGPERVADLSIIYVAVGEYDKALDQIEYLLSIPSLLSVPMLKIDPRWDPLREHSMFQRLLEKLPKNN